MNSSGVWSTQGAEGRHDVDQLNNTFPTSTVYGVAPHIGPWDIGLLNNDSFAADLNTDISFVAPTQTLGCPFLNPPKMETTRTPPSWMISPQAPDGGSSSESEAARDRRAPFDGHTANRSRGRDQRVITRRRKRSANQVCLGCSGLDFTVKRSLETLTISQIILWLHIWVCGFLAPLTGAEKAILMGAPSVGIFARSTVALYKAIWVPRLKVRLRCFSSSGNVNNRSKSISTRGIIIRVAFHLAASGNLRCVSEVKSHQSRDVLAQDFQDSSIADLKEKTVKNETKQGGFGFVIDDGFGWKECGDQTAKDGKAKRGIVAVLLDCFLFLEFFLQLRFYLQRCISERGLPQPPSESQVRQNCGPQLKTNDIPGKDGFCVVCRPTSLQRPVFVDILMKAVGAA
ncbi:hypothetical protein BDZ89DRAFT_1234154 [Hymenopellis radicata]|nr:hypothetical protein BDZ89DRAFT_1234154 [Hymenopellis radicata]